MCSEMSFSAGSLRLCRASHWYAACRRGGVSFVSISRLTHHETLHKRSESNVIRVAFLVRSTTRRHAPSRGIHSADSTTAARTSRGIHSADARQNWGGANRKQPKESLFSPSLRIVTTGKPFAIAPSAGSPFGHNTTRNVGSRHIGQALCKYAIDGSVFRT